MLWYLTLDTKDSIFVSLMYLMGFPGVSVVKNLPACAGDMSLFPGSERCLVEKKWQPTPVFLPGKSHEQRILTGYSPWVS